MIRRLVEHQHIRLVDQKLGEADAGLFAAAEKLDRLFDVVVAERA